jgi:hypothetical protein
MADCAPLQIAAAVAAEINAAVAAGTITAAAFTAKYSFADLITKLENVNATDGLLVDVVPAQKQRWKILTHARHRHEVTIKVGVRRRIDTTDRATADGAILTASVATYCNLLYQILDVFAVSSNADAGRSLSTVTAAAFDPRGMLEIQLYDEALLRGGLYAGWIHLPFVYHEAAA